MKNLLFFLLMLATPQARAQSITAPAAQPAPFTRLLIVPGGDDPAVYWYDEYFRQWKLRRETAINAERLIREVTASRDTCAILTAQANQTIKAMDSERIRLRSDNLTLSAINKAWEPQTTFGRWWRGRVWSHRALKQKLYRKQISHE
jgi:hypothetical protein